jgi:hypothetical protein
MIYLLNIHLLINKIKRRSTHCCLFHNAAQIIKVQGQMHTMGKYGYRERNRRCRVSGSGQFSYSHIEEVGLSLIVKASDRASRLVYLSVAVGRENHRLKRFDGVWVTCDEAECPSFQL